MAKNQRIRHLTTDRDTFQLKRKFQKTRHNSQRATFRNNVAKKKVITNDMHHCNVFLSTWPIKNPFY